VTFQPGAGSQGLGILNVSPFFATADNTFSPDPATVEVTYGHTIAPGGVDATLDQCSGMSLNGWYTGTGFTTSDSDFVTLSMAVTWLGCNGPNCNTPFQIGALGSVPCPSTPGAVATIPGSPPQLVESATDSFFFGPATPVQVFNLIPSACSNCTASARIDKTFRTHLLPGDSTNSVGSDLAFLTACGAPKAAEAKHNPVCTNPQVGAYIPVLLADQIDWVVPHDTITLGKQGMILSEVLDHLGVACTDLLYQPGGTPFLFGGTSYLTMKETQGAPLDSVSFQPGVCNLKHEEALIPGVSCNTKFIVLEGEFNTPGCTSPTDPGCHHFKIGAPVVVSGNCP
jgi:hypothetical protein